MYNLTTQIDFENLKPLVNNEGKNSTIFIGSDKQLGSEFILKKVEKALIYSDYESFDETNLFNESRILYKVSHPNITEIQYASYDDENIYLVMPFYKNGSIQSLINERFLTSREIVKYSIEFLCGLLHVHANNLIHFDIKPTNILINNNGKATLTDFGISKYRDLTTDLARPNKLYRAIWPPEIFSSPDLSHQCDVYQVGLTMYRMSNGNEIWESQKKDMTDDKIINGKFPIRNNYLPHISKKLRKIIDKCIDIDIDKRYDNVLNIINDLSNINEGLDWVYQVDVDKEIWLFENENKQNRIELLFNGHTYDMTTKKINLKNNSERKILEMCKNNINKSDAYNVINKFIKEN